MRVIASLALICSLGLAATAAQAAAPAWVVDKAKSKIGFDSTFSGTPFNGGFSDWSAAIAFDPKDLATSKVNVTINLVSAKTGDDSRDQSLPTADWFNTGKFPKASFTSNSFKALGADRYQAAGVLTIRGVAKPVILPFTLKINGAQAVMTGQTAIDRSQWGIGQGQFAGEDTVAHKVGISISITATKGK